MTRRLRPPAPLEVRCRPDGIPVEVRRGGRKRPITRVAATWVRPAPWWADHTDDGSPASAGGPPLGERTYFRLVIDGMQVIEAFQSDDRTWWIERIID
jgi:hypothetical protein